MTLLDMSDKVHLTASVTLASLDNHILYSVIHCGEKRRIYYYHFNLTKAYHFWDGLSMTVANFMVTFDISE